MSLRDARPTLGNGGTTEESVGELRIRISNPTDPVPTFPVDNAYFPATFQWVARYHRMYIRVIQS